MMYQTDKMGVDKLDSYVKIEGGMPGNGGATMATSGGLTNNNADANVVANSNVVAMSDLGGGNGNGGGYNTVLDYSNPHSGMGGMNGGNGGYEAYHQGGGANDYNSGAASGAAGNSGDPNMDSNGKVYVLGKYIN